ncbi:MULTISPECIES: metal ABC transporter substrate-binding protein [Tessaracoccus]|nr:MULTISPECIES: metal ABC transporter substrate-binding protein [Tessaracoccus]VEP41742.1 High-affinity zinc uptake system binding-protein ZnuA [Tessaracoccus lapidicaptus]
MSRLLRLLPAGLTALALAACGAPASEEDGAAPRVVAAFYPLEWAAGQVLGGHGSLSGLTTPGTEAHDLELTAQQIASLSDADLVLHLAEFQPAVDDAIAQSGPASVMDVSEVVGLIPAAAAHVDDHADEAGDGGEHADETDEHADEADDHGDLDPHFWQDPARMATLVEELGARLAELDPDNAADYTANAAATAEELQALDEEFTTGLATCERREFVTTHAAFGYLADRYDLTEIGISGVNPDAEPSPARIAEIHEEAARHGITTIFFETLTSDAVATSIAGDLGLETAVLDPLEGVTDNSPGTDYPSIMRANLTALRSANDCA